MQASLIAAIAFSLSQVLLSALLLFQQRPWGVREALFAILLLAITAYLVTPFAGEVGWAWLSLSVGTLVPGMFWLFSSSIFDDHFRLRGWQVLLVAATILPPFCGRLLIQFGAAGPGSGPGWLLFGLPQLLEFLLLGLTFWVVSRYWNVDLVESRRSLRLWFVGINGAYILALLLSREILFHGQGWLQLGQYLPVGGILLAMNALLLRYKSDVFFTPVPGSQTPKQARALSEPVSDRTLVAPLQALMDETRAYREMGLTIGQLAERMGVPQYRLRQTINAALGYRNFSDFLNRYRVAEAAARLADASESGLPVLTIAMDAGFRSLSSFNRAFKDVQGVTPTAWRKSAEN